MFPKRPALLFTLVPGVLIVILWGLFRVAAASSSSDSIAKQGNAVNVPTEGFLQLPFKPLPGQPRSGLDNVVSWFDHEYPLLPKALFPQSGREPDVEGIGDTTMIFTGDEKPNCFSRPRPDCYRYTGHNGIDFDHGVTAGTVISAAHAGWVTLPPFSVCALGKVNVTSDDGRYQTRYLHLDADVTTATYVEAGEYIGRVSGEITSCTAFPHLHFAVYFDRNGDGHFVTDEKLDPYGWLAIGQIDPWTTTFQDRFGDWHTGTPSVWLWNFDPPAQIVVEPGKPANLITSGGLQLALAAGSVESTAQVAYSVAPEPAGTAETAAVGRGGKPVDTRRVVAAFRLAAAYGIGAPFTTLHRPALLTIPYSTSQAAGVEETSLAVYWWDSGREVWLALPTVVDSGRQAAQAEITELGLFSLRGQSLTGGD